MNIQNKLFFILFGYSVVLIVTLIVLVQSSINKGMLEYVNNKEAERFQPVVSELASWYKKDDSWDNLKGEDRKLRYLVEANIEDGLSLSQPEERPRRPPPPHERLTSDPPRKNPPRHNLPPKGGHFALLNLKGELVAGKHYAPQKSIQIPIVSDDIAVGFIAIAKRKSLTKGYEFDFINQQTQYLWLIALLALAFVVILTIPLSRHLVGPLKLITQGVHKLTLGEYDQHIHVSRKDELGALSKDYNELALTLAESEKSRKRWLANISHELRTPVSIIRGELEAMLDNIRPVSKNNINSANDEVIHLQRLIEDLHLLASADVGGVRYQKSSLNLNHLLAEESEKFAAYLSNADIDLTTNFCPNSLTVYADRTRLNQLFENIFNNAFKYSKASKVKFSLSCVTDQETSATIAIEDNGIGVDDKHIKHLFDYLYRVDDARNRLDGGTGLGLSICRQIVDAHNGQIYAQKSKMGGLAVIINLPLTPNE